MLSLINFVSCFWVSDILQFYFNQERHRDYRCYHHSSDALGPEVSSGLSRNFPLQKYLREEDSVGTSTFHQQYFFSPLHIQIAKTSQQCK